MSALEFLDTNVLVYAYDPHEPRRQQIARGLVRRALAGEIVASSQVLGEFATTLLHKLTPATNPDDLIGLLDSLGPIKLVPLDGDVVVRALRAHAQYGLHFYDGLIVAAAERGGCQKIWSEDLNAGQRYFGIMVENPFV
ncbi:MAG TPA: PIN domain-containing protein [Candidatus Acidoferrum sp.]|nr:PIN domain-containing protein [Candidatus Acidoferrum sp.]